MSCPASAIAAPRAGDPDEDDAGAGGVLARPLAGGRPLLAATARWRVAVEVAPRLPRALGALAVDALELATGRAPALRDPLGDAGPPPRGWPLTLADAKDGAADGRVVIAAPGPTERIAVARALTSFDVDAAGLGARMLELRVRYEDGLRAYLNGVEVGARALPPAPGPHALATAPHGPEWETLYVPVTPGLLHLGANALALELHPGLSALAPRAEVALVARTELGLRRGPLLQRVGPGAATIVVETDPDVGVDLAWGEGALDHHVIDPPGRRHELALTGLPAHAMIRYQVHAGASASAVLSFHTAPAAGDVIRIGVYGDVRGGHDVHRRLVDAMAGEPLDVVLVTGDMVRRGSDEADWQRFFTITAELMARVPYYPAIGNHDLGRAGDPARRAEEIFALPPPPPDRPDGAGWYAHDVADVHLVFLDSNAYELVAQERWLEADLAAARRRGVRAIIAVTHDGPYSRGSHRGNKLARERYAPILARHHVDLLLAGHDHLYQRGERGGLRWVVSGGGGAGLYAVACGAAGKPACAVDDGLVVAKQEHHYLVVTITDTKLELCPRRADGSALERCTRWPLRT